MPYPTPSEENLVSLCVRKDNGDLRLTIDVREEGIGGDALTVKLRQRSSKHVGSAESQDGSGDGLIEMHRVGSGRW